MEWGGVDGMGWSGVEGMGWMGWDGVGWGAVREVDVHGCAHLALAQMHVECVLLLQMVHQLIVRWNGRQLLGRPLANPTVACRAEFVCSFDLRANAHRAVQAVLCVHLEPQTKFVAPVRLLARVLGMQAMAAEPRR